MRVSWFVEGNEGFEFVPLNFDASLDFHSYGINVSPEGEIDFYVDDINVKKIIGQMPRVRIFSNLYACNTSYAFCADELNYTGPTAVSMKWVKYCNDYENNNCTYQTETPYDDSVAPPYDTSIAMKITGNVYYFVFLNILWIYMKEG